MDAKQKGFIWLGVAIVIFFCLSLLPSEIISPAGFHELAILFIVMFVFSIIATSFYFSINSPKFGWLIAIGIVLGLFLIIYMGGEISLRFFDAEAEQVGMGTVLAAIFFFFPLLIASVIVAGVTGLLHNYKMENIKMSFYGLFILAISYIILSPIHFILPRWGSGIGKGLLEEIFGAFLIFVAPAGLSILLIVNIIFVIKRIDDKIMKKWISYYLPLILVSLYFLFVLVMGILGRLGIIR